VVRFAAALRAQARQMDFGARLGHDPSDLPNSRLVLLWGRNPMATNLHMVPLLKQVRASGGKVVSDRSGTQRVLYHLR